VRARRLTVPDAERFVGAPLRSRVQCSKCKHRFGNAGGPNEPAHSRVRRTRPGGAGEATRREPRPPPPSAGLVDRRPRAARSKLSRERFDPLVGARGATVIQQPACRKAADVRRGPPRAARERAATRRHPFRHSFNTLVDRVE